MSVEKEYDEPQPHDLQYEGWRHILPFRTASRQQDELPIRDASCCSFITSHWANSFMWQAFRHGIKEQDLYKTPWRDSSAVNAARFERFWKEEVAKYGKEKASVARAIMKMIKGRLIMGAVLVFIYSFLVIIGPALFVRDFLNALQSGDTKSMIINQILLVASIPARNLMFDAAITINYTAGVRVKGGVLSFLFKKILNQRFFNRSVGELVNLCANDGQRINEAVTFGIFCLLGIVSVLAAAYSIVLLGYWGILGIALFLAFLPLQVLVSKLLYKLRLKSVPITDERVRLMSEVITAIKLVKMYAWEKSFATKINNVV